MELFLTSQASREAITVPDPNPWIERFRRALTVGEPPELRNYLAIARPGPHFGGTSVPAIGAASFRLQGGLHLPTSYSPNWMDHLGHYVTISDYLDAPDLDVGWDFAEIVFSESHDRVTLITALAVLNNAFQVGQYAGSIMSDFRSCLAPSTAARLNASIDHNTASQHLAFFPRQPVLCGLARLIKSERLSETTTERAPWLDAILYTHAVAEKMSAMRDGEERIVGVPAWMLIELVRLGQFYEHDDVPSTIDRYVRLWTHFGRELKRVTLRRTPEDLLVEATGLTVDELLGLGFLLLTAVHAWDPEMTPHLPLDLNSDMDRRKIEAFLAVVSATLPELRDSLLAASSDEYDFVSLEKRPVLRTEDSLLVLDVAYLWSRVTSGLFWLVHDHEKSLSEEQAETWRTAYGEMVELSVQAAVRQVAPMSLGLGITYYSEEDIETAYNPTGRRSGVKKCDCAVYYGDTILLVEVVSGQISVPTRVDGDLQKFRADTDRLVIAKCAQLDFVARNILTNETALTGFRATPGLRILPLLVVGGGYPVNHLTMRYIKEQLNQNDLLQDARIEPLAIIDLGELEALEALHESGRSPVDVLRFWTKGNKSDVPFQNILAADLSRDGPLRRPSRMSSADATFDRIVEMLKRRN